MDTFATFLNTLQEKERVLEAAGTVATSNAAADLASREVVLSLLRKKPEGLTVDGLRKECPVSFMVLAQTLTALLAAGEIEVSGPPGKEHVRAFDTVS